MGGGQAGSTSPAGRAPRCFALVGTATPSTELLPAAGTTPTAQDVCAGDSERISRAGAPSGGDGGWVAVPTSLGGPLGHTWTSLTARAQGPAARLCGGKSGPDGRAVAPSRAPEPVHGRMTRSRRESRGCPGGSGKWNASIY